MQIVSAAVVSDSTAFIEGVLHLQAGGSGRVTTDLHVVGQLTRCTDDRPDAEAVDLRLGQGIVPGGFSDVVQRSGNVLRRYVRPNSALDPVDIKCLVRSGGVEDRRQMHPLVGRQHGTAFNGAGGHSVVKMECAHPHRAGQAEQNVLIPRTVAEIQQPRISPKFADVDPRLNGVAAAIEIDPAGQLAVAGGPIQDQGGELAGPWQHSADVRKGAVGSSNQTGAQAGEHPLEPHGCPGAEAQQGAMLGMVRIQKGVEPRVLIQECSRVVEPILILNGGYVVSRKLDSGKAGIGRGRHCGAQVMAVFGRIVRPDLLVSVIKQRPAQSHSPCLQPMYQHVIPVLGQGGRIVFGATTGPGSVLVKKRSAQGGLQRKRQQVRIGLSVGIRHDLLPQLVGQPLGHRLAEYIHELEPQKLTRPGHRGHRIPQELHKHPTLRIVGEDQSLSWIIPDRAQFGQGRVRASGPSIGVTVVELGDHGLGQGGVVDKMNSPDARGRHGNRLARAGKGFLGPIDLARRLHGRARYHIGNVGQGVIQPAERHLIGATQHGGCGIVLPPGHLDWTRHCGKDQPSTRAVIVPQAGT